MISHKELAVSSNHLILVIVLPGSPPVFHSPSHVGSVLGVEPKAGLELAAGLEFRTLRSRVGCLAPEPPRRFCLLLMVLSPAFLSLPLSFALSFCFCLWFPYIKCSWTEVVFVRTFFLHRYQFSRHSDLWDYMHSCSGKRQCTFSNYGRGERHNI